MDFLIFQILGQIDRKFIATKMNGKKTEVNVDFLVLFDQHAVDERVKLERNLAGTLKFLIIYDTKFQ